MVAMSVMRRFDNHLEMMEEFMATQGMETVFRNSRGEVMYVRHGKTVKLKLNKRQHLQVVK